MAPSRGSDVGVVLSGGGARGAYEAGVLAGIIEVLGLGPGDASPFQIVSGTSVGAINGAYIVAHAHRGDVAVRELLDVWRGLQIGTHLRIDVSGLLGLRGGLLLGAARRAESGDELGARLGRTVLDSRALEAVVRDAIPWDKIHDNVRSGTVKALIIAALHIATGRTTLFAELAPGVDFRPTRHPRLVASIEPISAEHVLASAAIPFLFPARRVGATYYSDGGLRFNTPIAPAIRAGARKLVVISLRHEAPPVDDVRNPAVSGTELYPHLVFLLGKIFNALLLDPVAYDLQVLDRFNRVMEVLESTLSPEELARVAHVLEETRGMPYRRLDTLVFAPSQDIGVAAGDHLRESGEKLDVGRLPQWLLARAATPEATWEADLASYLLFDGSFAERLIAMGRRDALAKSDAIRAFFRAGDDA